MVWLILSSIIFVILIVTLSFASNYLRGEQETRRYLRDPETKAEYRNSNEAYRLSPEIRGRLEEVTERHYDGWGNKAFYLLFISPAAFLLLLFGMFTTVDATEVVVVTRFGQVQEVISTPGFKTKSFLDTYKKYSTKIQEIEYNDQEGNRGVSFYSSDKQPVDAMLTVQWRINASEAEYIYSNFGGSVNSVRERLGSLVITKTKDALAVYSANQLIAQRAALSSIIESAIAQDVKDKTLPVTIVAVYLTDFSFSDAFEAAVEASMIAEQDKIKAETEKAIAIIRAQQSAEQIRIEAEASAEKAKIEAEAAKLRATTEAEALKIKSEAEAKAAEVLQSVAMETIKNIYLSQFTDDTERLAFEQASDKSTFGFMDINKVSEIVLKQLYYDTWDGKLPTVISDSAGIIINP